MSTMSSDWESAVPVDPAAPAPSAHMEDVGFELDDAAPPAGVRLSSLDASPGAAPSNRPR